MRIKFEYWKKKGVPFEKPVPITGNLFDVITLRSSIGCYLRKLYEKFDGPFFGIWSFTTPVLVVRSPELVKLILIKDFQYFVDRNAGIDEKTDSLGSTFLFFSKAPIWRSLRTKVTPIYTTGKLRQMFDMIYNSAGDMIEHITQLSIQNKTGNIKSIAANYTINVLTSTAFGLQANCFQYENAEFKELGMRMFGFNIKKGIKNACYFFSPAIVSLFKLRAFDDVSYEFIREAFWKAIEEREKTKVKRNDLIDIMIKMKQTHVPGEIKMGTSASI